MIHRCLFGFLLIGLLLPPPAQAVADLDARYMSADGRLQFDYPAAWVVDDHSFANMIVVGTGQSALNAFAAEALLPEGEIVLGMLLPHPYISPGGVFSGWRMLAELTGGVGFFPEPSFLSEPETTTINGNPAQRFDFAPGDVDSVWISVDYEWAALFVVLYGAFSTQEDTVLALLNTLYFQPTTDTLTFTSFLSDLSLNYPGDWNAYEIAFSSDVYLTGPDGLELWIQGMYRQNPLFSDDLSGLLASTSTLIGYSASGDTSFSSGDTDIGAPGEVAYGGKTGLQIDYAEPQSEGFALVLDFDGYLLAINLRTDAGTLARRQTEIDMVLNSLRYEAPEDETLQVWKAWHGWRSKGHRHYTLTVEHKEANFRAATHTLTVANGRVIAHDVVCTIPPGKVCDPADFDPNAYTVPSLYATAMRLARKSTTGDWRFTLTVDPDSGHPLTIGTSNPNIGDSGDSWTVVEYGVLEK